MLRCQYMWIQYMNCHIWRCAMLRCHMLRCHIWWCQMMRIQYMTCQVYRIEHMRCHILRCHYMNHHMLRCHMLRCHILRIHMLRCQVLRTMHYGSCMHYGGPWRPRGPAHLPGYFFNSVSNCGIVASSDVWWISGIVAMCLVQSYACVLRWNSIDVRRAFTCERRPPHFLHRPMHFLEDLWK